MIQEHTQEKTKNERTISKIIKTESKTFNIKFEQLICKTCVCGHLWDAIITFYRQLCPFSMD